MLAPRSRLQLALVGLLCAAAVQIAVPTSWVGAEAKAWSYLVVAGYAIVLAVAGLAANRPARAVGWSLVVMGFAGWVLADVVWTFEQYVFHLEDYPVPSDAVYLPAYAVLAAGVVAMIRTQKVSNSNALGSVLDIVIIATGASVFVASAVILPLIGSGETDTLATIVSVAYPIGDLVLLVAVAQLWTSPAVKSRSYTLLLLSLVASLVADLIWSSFTTSEILVPDDVTNACWLIVYVLVAAATCDPSMRLLGQSGISVESAVTARRLTLLAVGLLMPAAALLVKVATENLTGLRLIGVGALVLSVFALLRMATLLNVVQAQAVQLAALASCDPLTGAPNRRRWDHELSTACQVSKDEGTPVCVAMIDLDHFKRFNDKHGHQAGDLLLREAVAAWTDVLGDRGMLARYGGEEFAVLLPLMDVDDAVNVLYAMRAMTPSEQTFSAGVSRWEIGTEPALALAHADQGLYNAKRAGRDRIVAFPDTSIAAAPTVPTPSIVVQPIVDLATGEVVAHEALSRFGDKAPEGVFHLATTGGYADVLEGSAIAAAIALPGRPRIDLHVNASSAAMRSERFWTLIPDDLTGIVVEISEQYDGADLPALCDAVARLRARGAKIAADDLGSGSHELLRLAALKPDVVKLDRSLVSGCASDPGQQAVIRGGLAFVHSLGSTLCAEGVDNLEDLAYLRTAGVELAQCFLLGRPSRTWAPPYVQLPFAPSRSNG